MDLIRGRPVDEAMDLLRFTSRRSSAFIYKTLKSAVANADEQEADVNRLYVSEARVDAGPRMKRWHPKDRGRAHPINKPFSHLIVAVEQA
jgi:large subunit ribosomal protein L22